MIGRDAITAGLAGPGAGVDLARLTRPPGEPAVRRRTRAAVLCRPPLEEATGPPPSGATSLPQVRRSLQPQNRRRLPPPARRQPAAASGAVCGASRHVTWAVVTWATAAAGPTWAGNGGEEEAASAARLRSAPR